MAGSAPYRNFSQSVTLQRMQQIQFSYCTSEIKSELIVLLASSDARAYGELEVLLHPFKHSADMHPLGKKTSSMDDDDDDEESPELKNYMATFGSRPLLEVG